MSNKKGNYYKHKTKAWLDEEGYYTEYTEVITRQFNPKTNSLAYRKRDIFACDGISMNHNQIVFWNSVLGKNGISKHYKKFKEIPFPPIDGIKVWIIVWEKGARQPEIVDVEI